MSASSCLKPTFAVVDLFDHSAPRIPEEISRGPSSKSFASISIGRGGITLNSEEHGGHSPLSPAKATRMFSKKSVTINDEPTGDDASSLLSNDDFDVNATSRRRRNSSSNDEQSLAQLTFASVEDSIRYAVAHWKILLFGQLVSFLSATAAASQATLKSQCDMNAAAFSNALMYVGLTIFLVPLYFKRRREALDDEMIGASLKPMHRLCGIPIYAPVWKYVMASILHFYANYFVVVSFQYTSITSIMLLDALALPAAMFLSIIFLNRHYIGIHYLGAVVCMAGLVFNMLADYEIELVTVDNKYSNRLLGDLFACIGAILYGTNNVITEALVKGPGGPAEFLGCLGLFGTLWATLQAVLVERKDITLFFHGNTCPVATGGILMFIFAKTKGLTFFCSAHFLVISESALLNLSILTSDLWAVAFSVIAQHILPTPLFWVAVVFTFSGVMIYEIAPSPIIAAYHRYPRLVHDSRSRQASKSSMETDKLHPIM